jgi:hypothetical protein
MCKVMEKIINRRLQYILLNPEGSSRKRSSVSEETNRPQMY